MPVVLLCCGKIEWVSNQLFQQAYISDEQIRIPHEMVSDVA
jgi:hypothetical protein